MIIETTIAFVKQKLEGAEAGHELVSYRKGL